jgi:hypothetical protein
MFHSLLRKLTVRKHGSPRRRSYPLRIEAMEDRWMPSVSVPINGSGWDSFSLDKVSLGEGRSALPPLTSGPSVATPSQPSITEIHIVPPASPSRTGTATPDKIISGASVTLPPTQPGPDKHPPVLAGPDQHVHETHVIIWSGHPVTGPDPANDNVVSIETETGTIVNRDRNTTKNTTTDFVAGYIMRKVVTYTDGHTMTVVIEYDTDGQPVKVDRTDKTGTTEVTTEWVKGADGKWHRKGPDGKDIVENPDPMPKPYMK